MQDRLICDLNEPNQYRVLVKALEQVFSEAQIQVWIKDISGRYIYANDVMKLADDLGDLDIVGLTDEEVYAAEYSDIFLSLDSQVMEEGNRISSTYELPNGSYEEVTKMPVFNVFGEMTGILGYARDVTTEKLLDEHSRRMLEAQREFKAVYDNVPVGLVVYNVMDGMPIMYNERFVELLGYGREALRNLKWKHLPYLGKGNEEIAALTADLISGAINKAVIERQLVKGDDSLGWFSIIMVRFSGSGSKDSNILCVVDDITQSKEIKAELERVSYTDALTGLYNRSWFISRLAYENENMEYPYSVIQGDVNGLKICNDAFGHLEGDKLIAAAGSVFRKFANEYGNFAVRLGGDEFVAIFPGVEEGAIRRIETEMRNEIRNMSTSFMDYTVALGTATAHEGDKTDIDTLLKIAEERMYNAKIIESRDLGDKIIDRVIAVLRRDPLEASHMMNVERYAERMCQVLGLSSLMTYEVVTAARLHDIGMGACNGMRTAPGKPILNGKFGDADPVRKHSEIGYRLLHASRTYTNLADYVLHHHENLDGTGYPSGLRGDEIPIQSRIIRIVDYYDALTNPRFERNLNRNEVITELRKREGIIFDTGYTEMLINELILQDAL